jgi:hypothetical protein
MASRILQTHPLSSLPIESTFALVFESEDPFLMSLDRLESLIEATAADELPGYRFGLYDMRRAAVYVGK